MLLCFCSEIISATTVRTTGSLDIRLVGGTNSSTVYNGRVEIRQAQGNWGTICDDSFDNRDALVICRMLGYKYGRSIASTHFGQGTGDIFMDDVNCAGNESNILACGYSGWGRHNCNHREDVGVECSLERGGY